MVSTITQPMVSAVEHPTVWGLTPTELHDRFWAARGVQVVRAGEESEIVEGAELFLLMAPRLLTIFRLRSAVEQLSWLQPDVLRVRLHDHREHGYREVAVADDQHRFVRFQRSYGVSDARLTRAALTPMRHLAELWQAAPDARAAWLQLRRHVPRGARATISLDGRTYDRHVDDELMPFVRDLIQTWKSPGATIERARKVAPRVWGDVEGEITSEARFIGPAWVGAGRQLAEATSVVGPAVLWDDPAARPQVETIRWHDLERTEVLDRQAPAQVRLSAYRRIKRVIDLVVAPVALLCVLPCFPVIMLLIYLEDGRPFFFAHRRETVGGRIFRCLKFRSMRNDAERIKAQLQARNQADGPQFFMDDDPRLTRVGAFLRRFHLDELPQLFNVLVGDMSLVGPRPSPHEENQYCPTWREARLSVRPGMTGLWQVSRTRAEGRDFQEWIKFDIEYVDRASLRLDLWIIWKTIRVLISRRA